MRNLLITVVTAITSLAALTAGVAGGEPTGSLEGTITIDVKDEAALKSEPTANDKDLKTCGHEIVRENLLYTEAKTVKDGKETKVFLLKNAVVDIKIGLGKGVKPKDDNFVLDQSKCVYIPHILVVKRNGNVELKNSDDVAHNVHIYAQKNPSPNLNVPPGTASPYKPKAEEKIKVGCDIHPWMSAYIYVTNNPNYVAVTNDKGTFSIKDIPAGKYKVSFWHEELGEQTKEIEIKANETTKLDVSFKFEKK